MACSERKAQRSLSKAANSVRDVIMLLCRGLSDDIRSRSSFLAQAAQAYGRVLTTDESAQLGLSYFKDEKNHICGFEANNKLDHRRGKPAPARRKETNKAPDDETNSAATHTVAASQEQGDPSSPCCAAATTPSTAAVPSTQEQCYVCGVYTSFPVRLEAYGLRLAKGPPCPWVACGQLECHGRMNNLWLERCQELREMEDSLPRHRLSEVQSCAAASSTAISDSAWAAAEPMYVEPTCYQDQEWGPAALRPHDDAEVGGGMLTYSVYAAPGQRLPSQAKE